MVTKGLVDPEVIFTALLHASARISYGSVLVVVVVVERRFI